MVVGIACAKAVRTEGAWYMLGIKDDQDGRGYS